LPDEVKTLKKHFGGFVATLKALKEAVETLQKNTAAKENDSIKDILERQKVVEDGIASNGDALSRIDKEIDELSNKLKVTKDGINNQNVEKETGDELQKEIASKRIEN
jgi:predicted  nucleic acid-binding Zn-ribbon protein